MQGYPMKLYDNSRTVSNEQEILIAFRKRSLLSYQQHHCIRDIQYAEQQRANFDYFPLDHAKKTLIFLHGGYWQWCDKSDFAFISAEVLAKDMQCVLLEYDLAPHSRLGEMVVQVKAALDFLQQQAWINGQVLLVGHSAGAHLAAMLLDHPLITEAALLSGIYDLAQIQKTHLNAALDLSENEIMRFSPISVHDRFNKPYRIYCGKQELDELKWQSRHYFEQRRGIDQDLVSFTELKNIHHYNILDAYFSQILK